MLLRRLVTIPGYVIAWCIWLGAAPLWLPLAIVVDVVRRNRGVALRSAAFLTVYLSCEIVGMVAAGGLWAWGRIFRVDDERWTDLHFRLEAWWGTALFRAVVQLFGLRLEVESDADLGRGPYLLLLRHASTGDTLLASALVSRPHGVRLRYVLKRELLWDPCLDIVGHRLPNAFVDRFSDDSVREVRRVQELARDLGPRDGILIYPEGTRFSEAKRRRALERLHQTGDAKMVEYVRSLACVLPPRPGGTLGLLDAAPEADVVVCAHTGFEGSASLARIWNGALLHQVIRVRFHRTPRDRIPTERGARIAWIREEWQRVGAWVETHQAPRARGATRAEPAPRAHRRRLRS
jgi:1-acyl-sn-glycerol-3-phosphate acyltransferase